MTDWAKRNICFNKILDCKIKNEIEKHWWEIVSFNETDTILTAVINKYGIACLSFFDAGDKITTSRSKTSRSQERWC